MESALQNASVSAIPFVWFWPDGHKACAIVTHDIETAVGRDFCVEMMDIEASFGIKSSFQFVPEKRYQTPSSLLGEVRARGCEVNIHDLNHDGHLYSDRHEFLRRVKRINAYSKEYNADGFRSAILYRR